ncbi:hypothetical protein [Faecalitalea cylindroides]|uniref:hypothetical protein n=1 Tax=Faecalitalea cylindroides TaxID=39483 RepID=UPI002674E4FE|nr:hypothetical protein [Faecalitalea cylindroides]
MNKKLVLTGKAVLSTVMASTMACSMLSTNILAQEPEVVPEEETTVEKTPVEEEPTETPEEATGGNEETTSSNTITTNEIVDTPTTYSFPSGYDDSWTEQQLRDEIQRLLNEAASLYEENKYRPSTENDYITKKATAEAALADTTLAKDKLAWQAKYMSDCIKAMNTAQNVLSESAKQIVIINKEVAKLNPSEYQLDAWEALSSALSSAIGRINGNATNDFSEDLANIQSLYEAVLQTKVDENLVTLRDLVAECEVIVNNQYYPSRRVNYTRDSYANFTNALNEARTEVNKGETTIDPAVAQTLIDNLTQAKNNLVVVDENTVGQEYGINDKWLNGWDGNYANYNKSALVRGGSLYISGYKANGDGTVTVTVKWENSGIDPVTGGMFYNVPKQAAYNKYDAEYSYRPFEENDLKNGVKLTSTVELPDGDTDYSAIKVDPLNDDEVLNGFEKDFVVPAGSKINLTLTQKGTTSKAAYTLSLGTYYVPTEAEDTVDKSELKAWIDKINALNPDDYTQESWNKLQGALDVAEMFYELDGLKQVEIDLVVDRLEQNFNALVPADKTAPTVELSYEMTEEGVKVTLTANEAIQSIDGWTKVSDTQYQRVYAGAVDETITVYDLAGNEAEVQLTLADKTALKEAIKNFGNLEGSGKVYDNYVKVLNNGKALLEDPEATQEKVDNAARNIETCYFKVKVAALNTIYNPDTFDYSKYTTDSIIPVQNMYGITHNRTNNSYQESEAQGNIGQMALWLEKYEEAVAGLTLADQDEKYIGLNKDALSSNSKKQGNFNVIKQEIVNVDGTYKIQLTMEFINDGLHPIYGSELPNANGSTKFTKFSFGESDAKKARVHTYDSKMGASRYVTWQNVSKLDGQDSWSKGFKGTIILEPDEEYVTFEFKKGISDVAYSPWYYHVQPMDTTAPEYTVTYSNDGNPTNQDVTVTITANEPLQEVEGWTLSDDGLSLTKTYSENKEETVVIADASGNTSEVPVNVTGIDKLGPTVTVKNETTEDGVLVTIETSEPIQTPDGWTKVSDTKYTKLYTENTSEDIIVYDLAGNATKAHVTVSSISKPGTGGSDQDKNQGTDTKKEDSKKTDGTNTGVFVGTGLFAGSATAAAAGASLLAFLKKRKK